MHSEGVLLKVNTSLMCTETDYVLSPLFTAPPFYVNYHEECTLKEVNTSLMCTETDGSGKYLAVVGTRLGQSV